MNKKLMIAVGMVGLAVAAFAGPHGGRPGGGPRPGSGPRPAMRPGSGHRGPAPRPAPPPPRRHHSGWGRGGREFWPGFAGGVIGGLVVNSITPPPPPPRTVTTIVTTPTVISTTPVVVAPVTQVQNVWVEGRYVDQIQSDGSVVRVWQPGHYEQRTVVQ